MNTDNGSAIAQAILDGFDRHYALFREYSRDCICPPQQPICTCDHRAIVRLVTRKAIQASEVERVNNPRSRSARLRVVEKLMNNSARND